MKGKNVVKKFLLKIYDNIHQIIDLLILAIALIVPNIINVQGMFAQYVDSNIIEPGNVFYILLFRRSNLVIGVALCIILWISIRKYNYERITMNSANTYHAYPYCWYWFSAKILHIKKCNLKNVPHYIQVKLIINNVFEEFPLDDNDFLEDEIEVKVEKKNFRRGIDPKEINIIIEDTYPIEHKQLPKIKSDLASLRIYRDRGDDLSRHYSPKLVNTVVSELRKLPDDITINMFATLNPKNMIYVAKGAFAMAERGNVIHLNVFQQNSRNGRFFKPRGKKIF